MADQVTVTNLADSGSPARVAYDLWNNLKNAKSRGDGTSFKDHVEERLQLYVACRRAVDYGEVDVSKLK